MEFYYFPSFYSYVLLLFICPPAIPMSYSVHMPSSYYHALQFLFPPPIPIPPLIPIPPPVPIPPPIPSSYCYDHVGYRTIRAV